MNCICGTEMEWIDDEGFKCPSCGKAIAQVPPIEDIPEWTSGATNDHRRDREAVCIHRSTVHVGVEFSGPSQITFGYQDSRGEFSIWYMSNAVRTDRYLIVGTGHPLPQGASLVQSVVMPDGHHVFHLVKL